MVFHLVGHSVIKPLLRNWDGCWKVDAAEVAKVLSFLLELTAIRRQTRHRGQRAVGSVGWRTGERHRFEVEDIKTVAWH